MTMIHTGASPSEQSHLGRALTRPAAELLPRVLEALPMGAAVFEVADDEFRFAYGNRGFVRVLSLHRAPTSGQLVGEIFRQAEHDAIMELFRLVQVSREPQSFFAPAGGQGRATNRIWNIDVYPLLSAGRVSHVLLLAEQTEETLEVRQRQQLEADRLRQKAHELAGLEKAKSEFLRLASHELRAPAAMLGGYLSMIEDETLGPIPNRLRLVLPMLKAKADQINLLANEMVEAARLEDGRPQLKRKRVDLREIVRRNVATAQAGATPRHRVCFDDLAGAAVWVLGDVMRLDIIIGNLLENAIKYSPDGGDVTAKLSAAGDLVTMSVRDEGIGIAADDMDRLFVRFSRLAPTGNVPGTGLGLYLARELARLHKGDITAVSQPGEGSEFILSLPLEPAKK
ncbi:MAG TPA: HAMP domain-containing sensor histidine kinase [Candidatus Dormibacteraeota bacterium]